MFRCIKCGQSKDFSLLNVMGQKISFSFNELNTWIVAAAIEPQLEDSEMTEEKLITELTHTLPNIMDMNIECGKCAESVHIEDLRTGFEDPLEYFETENICHCGGELWMDQIPGTRTYAFVCDKCDWVKPMETVSGA